MGIEFKELKMESCDAGKVNFLSIIGKLDKSDYELFVPMLEAGIKRHGKINILLELHDFHGWSAGAAWEDTKFGVRHFNDIENLAIIGDRKWERSLARFAKVFTRAKVRYFEQPDAVAAYDWMNEVSKT
jgi:hypothetical protein